MVEVKANFRTQYKDTSCTACGKQEETTEHVLECEEYRRLTGHTIKVDKDKRNAQMTDGMWLRKASEAIKQIEETRKLLYFETV